MSLESTPPTDDTQRSGVGRRTFIIGATTALAAACSGSDDGGSAPAATTASPDETAAPATTAESSGDVATTATPTTGAPATSDGDEGAGPDAVAPLTAAAFDALAICMLSPSSTEGPFPNVDRVDRSDISEGRPGHPLRLGFRVVDEACTPIPDAIVRVWHCDSTGDYSAYSDGGDGKDEGEGTNFCRGFQVADADGIVDFHTIYPGWYPGRAVHIHVQVVVDDAVALTTQVYFDEAYTEQVFATGVYAEFGPPGTTWASDRIAGSPDTDGSALSLDAAPTIAGPGTLGLINLGVPTA